MQNQFGLIGRTLSHSFSKGYFTEKFEKLGLSESHEYHLFELEKIKEFPDLVKKLGLELKGLNVTIPYKQEIMPFLDEIDEAAQKIGAVNTIKVLPKLKLKGYNSDYWGFRWTLETWPEFREIQPQKALVLGKGGAAKAVVVALNDLGIEVQYVSRKKEIGTLTYEELTQEVIDNYQLIINTTPLGMYPNVDSFPEIPYHLLSSKHLLYDLVYNPAETLFLKKGKENGIKSTHSGLAMLHGQAEKAWEIWGEE
ncbi:MAG: shikimate dehydrogenase [Bacteroidota bacterium]